MSFLSGSRARARRIIEAGPGPTSERRPRPPPVTSCRILLQICFGQPVLRDYRLRGNVHPPTRTRKSTDMPPHGSNPDDVNVDRHRRRQAREDGAQAEGGEAASALGIPGISEDALSPELREAVARLAAERDRLRDELARARSRIASLERLADQDSLTVVA